MLEHKIGAEESLAMKTIAEFFEKQVKDVKNLRKADKILREGLKLLDKLIQQADLIKNLKTISKLKKEQANLSHYYSRFAERMELFNQIEVEPLIQ